MTKAIELAKYIVNKCVADNHPITNLQLQKILYYVQRDYLHKHGEPAFRDEIEARKFGPIVPKVYYAFCYYGAMPIENRYDNASEINIDFDLVNKIVEEKRILKPWDIMHDIHKSDGAWDKTYRNGEGNRNTISIELISEEIQT